MKFWQRNWLFVLILFSLLHLLRDFLQGFGVVTPLSTAFAKNPAYPEISSGLWTIFDTYAIAAVEILLSIACLKRNSFGKLGNLTMFIALIFVAVWLVYWFFL